MWLEGWAVHGGREWENAQVQGRGVEWWDHGLDSSTGLGGLHFEGWQMREDLSRVAMGWPSQVGDSVPSHFTKQLERQKVGHSSEIKKGPWEGTDKGCFCRQGVFPGQERGTKWFTSRSNNGNSARCLSKATQEFKFPLHHNMQFYWETSQASPCLTKHRRHSNKIKQDHENDLGCRNPQCQVSTEVQLIICRIPDNSWPTLVYFHALSRNGFEVRALWCLLGLSIVFNLQQRNGKTK